MKTINWLLSLTAFCTLAPRTTPAATNYVWQDSPSPLPPFNTWATAAHTIQDAVDAAQPGDTVLVTNGVYSSGGRAVGTNVQLNRVAVDRPITLLSVNGPSMTSIVGVWTGSGDGNIRCAYVGAYALLSGFTLTNGHTLINGIEEAEKVGGGAWCEDEAVVSNCVLVANSAHAGGGACGGTFHRCVFSNNSATSWGGGGVVGPWERRTRLYNCLLTGNSTVSSGGGAFFCELYSCILTGNSANDDGGGVYAGTLYNCIVYFNTARLGPNFPAWDSDSISLSYCCTSPLPTNGVGTITNAPLFVDLAGGNLRLQHNSPCINSGNNSYITTSTDLDGNPRIVSGTVDIGAYEHQGAGSLISYAWLQQYSLPTDGSADLADPDGDQMNNWQEWQADTNPTNPASILRLTILSNRPPVAVTFSSCPARLYTLLRCSNLMASAVWTPVPRGTDVPGNGDALTLTDASPSPTAFYRVSVRLP